MTASPTATALDWTWLADVPGVRAELAAMLARSVSDEGILGYTDPPTPDQSDAFVDDLDRATRDGSGQVLVGRTAGRVVSMVVMSLTDMPNCRHIAGVSKAFIDPSLRGTAAVVELAAQVARRAADLGVAMLVIDVREGSKAHAVWQRMGFQTFGILPDYSRSGGRTFRGHYMHIAVPALLELTADVLQARRG